MAMMIHVKVANRYSSCLEKAAKKHRISFVANEISTSWTSADIGYRLFDADYPVW